ncbi:hypothetical protein GQ600_2321 [Phytophthora cactorum]|nr:hypothetical protein GQ600_2321 [Phytophthora cactorum]
MEIKTALGVEEWAFVQSALESGNVSRNNRLVARRQQLETDDQEQADLEKLVLAKQQADQETEVWIAKLEKDNRQLHKMWKDEVTKRLDLEKKLQRLDGARMKHFKESKRLRKICLHQVATLIGIRQKMCPQDKKPLPLVVEQEKKAETMEQWLMSGLKTKNERCRETEEVTTTLHTQEAQRVKKNPLETQAKVQPLEDDKTKKQTPSV